MINVHEAMRHLMGRGRVFRPASWAGRTLFNRFTGERAFLLPDGRVQRADGSIMPPIAGGGSATWIEAVDITTADGAQISNSTSETIVCPDLSIPAYTMTPGKTLRIAAFGVNSNVVTTPGTLILRVRWGGVAGTLLLATAAIGLDTTARTNALWLINVMITCRAAGATGTFLSGGWASVVNVLASVGVSNNGAFNSFNSLMGSAGAPIASGSAGVTVDTTTAKLLSVTAQFSVATNPTNLTCQQRVVELLN